MGRFQSAQVRRGIGVAMPGALPLEGLAPGRYEVEVTVDGKRVSVPALDVTD